MTTQFITNQEKLLSEIVKNIFPCSKTLYFLVGYFSFSGFEEVYKEIAYLHNSTKQEKTCLSENARRQIKDYECQIDQMVYRLYGLTEEEIVTTQ